MSRLAQIALQAGRPPADEDSDVVDLITFIEAPWGLNTLLFPVQRVLLKALYGLELDDVTPDVAISDFTRETWQHFTEAGYLRFLHKEGRCNISEVIPGEPKREFVLAVGRRSGKSFITSCICAYETYKLIKKGNPQSYYGLPASDVIQLISVATDKDQAGLLYQSVKGHYLNCFAAETEIITADGIKPIGTLAGTTQTLLTRGGAWVQAPIRCFGRQRLHKLTLQRQGAEKVVYATADHRWFAQDARKAYRGSGHTEFKTTELRPGVHRLQYVFGRGYKNLVIPSPFGIAHGFTYGDGSTAPRAKTANSVTMIGDKDANLQPYFALCPQHPVPAVNGLTAGALPNFFRDLPPIRENTSYLLGWLMGYFAADGCSSGGQVVLYSAKRSDIEFVRDVCAVLGIGTYAIRRKDTISNLTGRPHVMYSIVLMRSTLDETFFIIPEHRQAFMENGGPDVGLRYWTVKAVEETDRIEDVFCATVDKHGAFALEGNILTGNCPFFAPYVANLTQTFATFQTPKDVETYGAYATSDSKKASIRATFRSCVAEGLRGAGNIVAVLDEMAHFGENGSSSADEVLTALKPSIAAYSPKDPKDKRIPTGPVESKLIAISSPLGKSGTFYHLYNAGFGGGKDAKTMLCVQAPSWEVNPTIEASFLEGEYRANANKFFTEFGAQFSDRMRGWIERQEDLFDCIDYSARPQAQAPARRPHFIGIDVGLVGDGTAIAIGHIDQRGQIIVDLVDQIKAGEGRYAHRDRLEFDDVADWIFELSRRFYLVEGIFDQWAGIPFEQALVKRGLSKLTATHMTKNKASEIYENFKNMMWDKRITLYDWPIAEDKTHCDYVTELLELQAEYHSKYVTVVQAPNVAGKHDDRSDALVRMVWLASQNMGKHSYVSKGAGSPGVRQGQAEAMAQQRRAAMKSRSTGSSPERQVPRGFGSGRPVGGGPMPVGGGPRNPYGRR